MRLSKPEVIFLCATALTTTYASAEVTQLSGSFTNLNVVVTDLNLQDQYVPSPVLLDSARSYSSLYTWAYADNITDSRVSQNVTGQDTLITGELSASWQIASDWRSASNTVELGEQGLAGSYSSFTNSLRLAPYSSITISGHYVASWVGPAEGVEEGHVLGQVVFSTNNVLPFQQFNMQINAPGSIDRDFSVTLVNDTANYVYGEMSHGLYLGFENEGAPPPVPEPGTYLMMGTGIVLVGAAIRRRNVPKRALQGKHTVEV